MLARTALPLIATLAFAVLVSGSLWAGSLAGTLGYDFLAYQHAANRLLAGEALYDPSIQQAGGFGLFLYPPPFVLLMLPFAPLEPGLATWVWMALSLAAFLVGALILPVRATVRWLIILLAALSWPFEYGLRLGQVGQLLFLLFAVGWRWLDDARAVGGSAAAGALVKVQPGLLLVWAALTRRWGAVLVGIITLAAFAVIATLVAGGPTVWFDYVGLLGKVSDPIMTPHNFTPGAVAYQLGAAAGVAAAIQLVSSLAVLVVVALAALRASAPASYLAAVVASQLLSPVLWDHYAMLLLLPVAYLLDRGKWWAAVIPLVTSVFAISVTPAAAYPIVFWITLVAVVAFGIRNAGPAASHAGA
jgi:hypothetical protein